MGGFRVRRRSGCPIMKRVLVDLRLGAIEQTNARKREREIQRDNQKSTNKTI